jgi:hypothetical protein
MILQRISGLGHFEHANFVRFPPVYYFLRIGISGFVILNNGSGRPLITVPARSRSYLNVLVTTE